MINYYNPIVKLRYALQQKFNTRLAYVNAVVAGLCILICAGYWLPIKSKIDAIDGQIENKRNEISRSIKLKEKTRLYQRASKNVALIEKRLNTDTRQATIIDNVSRLAKRYRVHIIDEAFEEGRGKKHYQPLNHDITVEGSYTSLRNFLHAIDGLPTWTVIIESKISLHGSKAGIVVASLRLATYRKT